MTKETIEQTKKFIIEDEEKRLPGRRISIQFFGGEPTLEWNTIVDFVESLNAEADKKLGRKINWGMTTNGTLLNEDRIRWLKKINLKPLLSLDGRKGTHNKHRKYLDGSGSWDDIPFDLFLKYFPNPEIRPTILPDTVESWGEDLAWFHNKGCYTVATEVSYESNWTPESMKKAWKTYSTLAEMYIDSRLNNGHKLWMKFIEDGKKTLGMQKQTGPVCGIGRNTVAIDASGLLYACQRYASFSDKTLNLGNVWDGFDFGRLNKALELRAENIKPDKDSPFDCKRCPALWRCRKGCNAMNYQVKGNRYTAMENYCQFMRMWSVITLRTLAITGELWTGIKKSQNKPNQQNQPKRIIPGKK